MTKEIVFNESFFSNSRLPKIVVIKNPKSWLIRQKFVNKGFKPEPGPWKNDQFNVPEVVVEIVIDFESFKEDRKIQIKIDQIGFVRRCVDPYELFNGYPIDRITCWLTPWGENLASWSSRLTSNGALRPTERDLFEGKTRAEIRKERENKEIKHLVGYYKK